MLRRLRERLGIPVQSGPSHRAEIQNGLSPGELAVLEKAGATLPRRDAVDERIVREVRAGTGHIIKWVEDAGGWPEFPAAKASSTQPK